MPVASMNMILITIIVYFVFVISLSEQGSINDHMCQINRGLLCVKDELATIARKAQEIAGTILEIEQEIKQRITMGTLNKYVNIEMNSTHASLPSLYYHLHFFQKSNIGKEYLIKLLLEAHNAMIYFSNTIDDLRHLKGFFAQKIDDRFKKIQTSLKDQMICRYRNVLYVYSQSWQSMYEVNDRIEFSKMIHSDSSDVHSVRSIVIGRHLRQWMEDLTAVIEKLEGKLV
ncbi:hypothetical protein I4U23_008505 [Adineta vaga]|nr:hypothetical protein I4U23_008505 [Adineta vaga]